MIKFLIACTLMLTPFTVFISQNHENDSKPSLGCPFAPGKKK